MTELADKLGIELEDFLVETGDLTDKQINQILHRCVTLGAKPYESIKGYRHGEVFEYTNTFKFFGVKNNKTYITDARVNTVSELKSILYILKLKPMHSNGVLSYIPEEDADLLLSMGSPVQDNKEALTTSSKLDIEIEVLERTLSSLKNIRGNLK